MFLVVIAIAFIMGILIAPKETPETPNPPPMIEPENANALKASGHMGQHLKAVDDQERTSLCIAQHCANEKDALQVNTENLRSMGKSLVEAERGSCHQLFDYLTCVVEHGCHSESKRRAMVDQVRLGRQGFCASYVPGTLLVP